MWHLKQKKNNNKIIDIEIICHCVYLFLEFIQLNCTVTQNKKQQNSLITNFNKIRKTSFHKNKRGFASAYNLNVATIHANYVDVEWILS